MPGAGEIPLGPALALDPGVMPRMVMLLPWMSELPIFTELLSTATTPGISWSICRSRVPALRCQLITRAHAHRCSRTLEIALAVFRGDDHFFQHAAVGVVCVAEVD